MFCRGVQPQIIRTAIVRSAANISGAAQQNVLQLRLCGRGIGLNLPVDTAVSTGRRSEFLIFLEVHPLTGTAVPASALLHL